MEKIRIQKLLADAGYCSRRQAEKLISDGKVKVNGHPVKLGDKATLADLITVGGERVYLPRKKQYRYLMLYKPRGYVTTLSDEQGRKTVAELVSGCGARVYPVGRLDLDSEGLLLFTNDGSFANLLTHPSHGVAKLYRVTVRPRASEEQIAQLATGEITNWADVGGTDGQVVFMGREAGSGTRDGFESITGTKDACKYQNELTSTGEVIAAVASNPNAIGYASLSAVDETVKAITVGGVEPTEETVLDGSYAIQRNFNFIVSDSTPLSEAAQAFVDFATSADASDLIAGAGAVPVAE